MKKIISVIGSRPNYIKILRGFPQLIIDTGQHYDKAMSDDLLKDLSIAKPKYNLGCRGSQIGKMITKLSSVFSKEKPDLILVYGDTNSALAGAVSAYQLKLPLAHIEAGMRCGNRLMIEENNRIVIDHLADYNFCPTKNALNSLKQEGLANGYFTGDVMYDRFLHFYKKNKRKKNGHFILLTCHRAENVDKKEFLASLFREIKNSGQEVVFPIHPRTEKKIKEFNINLPKNIELAKPLTYSQMLVKIAEARLVMTDSGGVQKEAYWLGKPCLILRTQTEWPEIIDHKTAFLIKTNQWSKMADLMKKKFSNNKTKSSIFGDGRTELKIKQFLKNKGYL